MAQPNPLLLWPIRFTAASYVLRVSVNGGAAQSLTFSIAAGRDYWLSGDGAADTAAGDGDLLARLKAAIETHTSGVIVNVTRTAGMRVQVAIASGATTINLLWADALTTLNEAIFGFTADTGAAASHTAPNLPHGIWRPEQPIGPDSQDQQPVAGGLARTLLGATRASSWGTPNKEREIGWAALAASKVLTENALAAEPTGAFEYAWVNSIALGRRLRLYADETLQTYVAYTTRSLADPKSRFERWPIYWDVRLELVRA